MSRPYKRKHFFVKKPMQTRYIFYIVATLSVVAIASSICIYFGVWSAVLNEFSNEKIQSRLETTTRLRQYEDARIEAESTDAVTLSLIKEVDLFSSREREIINAILKDTYKQLYPLLFALVFFIGWGSIFITHKIAGPLFRLESCFEKLSEGKLDFRVQFRKGDELKYLAPSVNKFVERFDGTMGNLKDLENKLSKTLRDQNIPAEGIELLSQMRHELDTYQTTRRKF